METHNYEYIIASLPVLSQDGWSASTLCEQEIMQDILEQCTASDRELIECLTSGWNEESLTPEFYSSMTRHRDPFLRRYFSYDLMARNAKASYLNRALGRPVDQDVLEVPGAMIDEEELSNMQNILSQQDLLERERGIDDAYWAMIDEAVIMEVFSIDVILAFVAKLHIVERWLRLDPETGRRLFRQLVDEVRGSYAGLQFAQTK